MSMVLMFRCAGSGKYSSHSEVVSSTTTPPLAYAVLSQNTPHLGMPVRVPRFTPYNVIRSSVDVLYLANVGIYLGIDDGKQCPVNFTVVQTSV
jgi:hypothetical protein